MSDYQLVRARSAVALRSPSTVLITRTRSVPDLSIYSSVYKPQWSYYRTAYPLYDDWYSRYLCNRYYYPYTYRSSLYSNYYWDSLTLPYLLRYGYPYYNYYYSRPYNPYLSSRLNYLMDKSYWWERDRYFYPTYYYRRYYDWLYD
ncbi:hypothetical protein QR680_001080 [Steinernema hermaphroditum]|uniref:Uncharacterized protein n=1 Tax=Steinernema hermaphroditum TaxID=289476 RepID=A0AA39GYG6_9BILA|nr:hypothetical protein QR680_001080 [Steinernema hermaphroditum]